MSATPSANLDSLEKKLEANPASKIFLPLAEQYRLQGNLDRAAEILKAGLEHNAGYSAAKVALSRVMLERGEVRDGRLMLTALLEVVPDNLLAQKLLAEAGGPLHEDATDAAKEAGPDEEASSSEMAGGTDEEASSSEMAAGSAAEAGAADETTAEAAGDTDAAGGAPVGESEELDHDGVDVLVVANTDEIEELSSAGTDDDHIAAPDEMEEADAAGTKEDAQCGGSAADALAASTEADAQADSIQVDALAASTEADAHADSIQVDALAASTQADAQAVGTEDDVPDTALVAAPDEFDPEDATDREVAGEDYDQTVTDAEELSFDVSEDLSAGAAEAEVVPAAEPDAQENSDDVPDEAGSLPVDELAAAAGAGEPVWSDPDIDLPDPPSPEPGVWKADAERALAVQDTTDTSADVEAVSPDPEPEPDSEESALAGQEAAEGEVEAEVVETSAAPDPADETVAEVSEAWDVPDSDFVVTSPAEAPLEASEELPGTSTSQDSDESLKMPEPQPFETVRLRRDQLLPSPPEFLTTEPVEDLSPINIEVESAAAAEEVQAIEPAVVSAPASFPEEPVVADDEPPVSIHATHSAVSVEDEAEAERTLSLARLYRRQGRLDLASDVYRQVLDADPDDMAARRELEELCGQNVPEITDDDLVSHVAVFPGGVPVASTESLEDARQRKVSFLRAWLEHIRQQD